MMKLLAAFLLILAVAAQARTSGPITIYVDVNGNDSNTGLSPTPCSPAPCNGPLASITRAAQKIAVDYDLGLTLGLVQLGCGTFTESVGLPAVTTFSGNLQTVSPTIAGCPIDAPRGSLIRGPAGQPAVTYVGGTTPWLFRDLKIDALCGSIGQDGKCSVTSAPPADAIIVDNYALIYLRRVALGQAGIAQINLVWGARLEILYGEDSVELPKLWIDSGGQYMARLAQGSTFWIQGDGCSITTPGNFSYTGVTWTLDHGSLVSLPAGCTVSSGWYGNVADIWRGSTLNLSGISLPLTNANSIANHSGYVQ